MSECFKKQKLNLCSFLLLFHSGTWPWLIIWQVLAASQQEYIDSFKGAAKEEGEGSKSSQWLIKLKDKYLIES